MLKWFLHCSMVVLAIFFFSITNTYDVKSSEDKLDWDRYSSFINEQNFDEAWGLIKDVDGGSNSEIFVEKGMLLGSGQLSSGVQRCEAVQQLEAALELGALGVLGLLNSLYGGDWISIASIEGNRIALEMMAWRILDYPKNEHVFFVFDKNRAAREAAPYMYRSAELGNEAAIRRLARLSREYPEIFNREKKSGDLPWADFKEIYCPTRVY
ncbi:MAG: hypothetical protein GY807_04480 [Gammaproteobacteria bacterium]|nr:hypothetical protein [Gammaproteobacteria bacterium]